MWARSLLPRGNCQWPKREVFWAKAKGAKGPSSLIKIRNHDKFVLTTRPRRYKKLELVKHEKSDQPACQWVDFSFQWQPPSQWGEMVRLGMVHPFKTLLAQPWKNNQYHWETFISWHTTTLDFLSRVLFYPGGRTCLLSGRGNAK